MPMNSKETLRQTLTSRQSALPGEAAAGNRVAQALRGLEAYRQAATVFCSPAPLLLQSRINILGDGKNLLLPTGGLRDGFLLLAAGSVPFRQISFAATSRGAQRHGRPLRLGELAGLDVGLGLTEALAVDHTGHRLGDGSGYFDLAWAILAEAHALVPGVKVCAALEEGELFPEPLPTDAWDISVGTVLYPGGAVPCRQAEPDRPRVHWEYLEKRLVRRIKPLWELYWREEERKKEEERREKGEGRSF